MKNVETIIMGFLLKLPSQKEQDHMLYPNIPIINFI